MGWDLPSWEDVDPTNPENNPFSPAGVGTGFATDTLGQVGDGLNDLGGTLIDDTLGTNFFGDNSTDRALAAQREAANQANQFLGSTYESQIDYLDPWASEGSRAMKDLAGGNFMNNWQADPGYQFRLEEGKKALEGSAAAKGMLNSSGTMKSLMRYGQGLASQEYGNAYNREFNRLSQLAGYGQDANNSRVNATGAYGASVSNNMTGLGNAIASANIAQSNRVANMLGMGAQGIGMAYGSGAGSGGGGGGGAGASGTIASCDRNVKTDIEPVSPEDLAELKAAVKPYHFKYIDTQFGMGPWAGVMAQDLEKTKLGKLCVNRDADGTLKVDLKKLYSILVISLLDAEEEGAA